uniref:Protein kinase domain-containing protein n=1 Tax=Macrostomum lignano TaxID=282301 RepID=A0A1I8JRH1_9PLAT
AAQRLSRLLACGAPRCLLRSLQVSAVAAENGLTRHRTSIRAQPSRQMKIYTRTVRLELGCTLLGSLSSAERSLACLLDTSVAWHFRFASKLDGVDETVHRPARRRLRRRRMASRRHQPAVDSQLTRSSSLQLILSSISAERGKSTATDRTQERFWTNLLIAHFLEEDERSVNGGGSAPANGDLKDDLVFYILSDQLIDVEESVYLNLIMQQLQLQRSPAPCAPGLEPNNVQILKRFSTQVCSHSPSRHCMRRQGQQGGDHLSRHRVQAFTITTIYLRACVVTTSELICVELVRENRLGDIPGRSVFWAASGTKLSGCLSGQERVPASQPTSRPPGSAPLVASSSCACAVPAAKARAEVAVCAPKRAADAKSELATTLATQNYHQQQLDYPSDEVEAGPRRTRRFSGTNRQQQQQHSRTSSSGAPASAKSRRQCRLASLVGPLRPDEESRSDSENVVDATTASSTSAAATCRAVASNAEVESRGIEEELDDQSAAAASGARPGTGFKERRRASSIGP